MGDNRQIIVICSDPGLDLKVLAGSILAEFNAVCFLDYLGINLFWTGYVMALSILLKKGPKLGALLLRLDFFCHSGYTTPSGSL
jgi:hypothetical protein